jgi:endonuclease III-like uncharacterized protein
MNAIHGSAARKSIHPNGIASVDPNELIDCIEAAGLLRQKPQTLAVWRCEGRGPEYVKVGRSIFYRRSGIGEFLAASIVIPSAA